MLLTMDDMCFLSKYLVIDDKEKRTRKLKVAVEEIAKEDKEKLLSFDEAYVLIKGFHMISDYEKLL